MRLQTLLRAVFPPECLCCGARVDRDFALCGPCWRETPFIFGAACDLCGVGLPGQTDGDEVLVCDDCHGVARPWGHGRAVLHYADNGRKLVLGLKHADRADALIRPRHTASQDGRDREGRFANLDAAIRAHPRHVARLAGRRVLLIDDVMTSGATFSAAAQACLRAGADGVDVIALARVARDG